MLLLFTVSGLCPCLLALVGGLRGLGYHEEAYPGEENHDDKDIEGKTVALGGIVKVAGKERSRYCAYHCQRHGYSGDCSVVRSTEQVSSQGDC